MRKLIFILIVIGFIANAITSIYANKIERQLAILNDVRAYEPARVVSTVVPTTAPRNALQTALVSWYGRETCAGREYGVNCKTASGEVFDENDLTFASLNFKFSTRIRFCHHGNCVVCWASDRGPYIAGRSFDLSLGCASAIGITGIAKVNWEEVYQK